MLQQWIAFGIVALAAAWVLWRAFSGYLAEPLAKWLLARGQVSRAMRVRKLIGRPGCDACGKD